LPIENQPLVPVNVTSIDMSDDPLINETNLNLTAVKSEVILKGSMYSGRSRQSSEKPESIKISEQSEAISEPENKSSSRSKASSKKAESIKQIE